MTTPPTAAINRLSNRYYNEGPFSAQNPGGLDESDDGLTAGHVTNFPAALVDVGDVVEYAGQVAGDAAASAGNAANSAQAAAADRQAVASDKTAVHADRLAADADAQATAADRLAVAQDKTAAAGSASAADQYASAAGGAAPAMRGNWTAVTADADAGNGKVWANSATLTAATVIYVDNLDAAGTSVTTVVDRWGTATNAVKGTLRIAHRTDLTKWVEYQVTGAVIDGGGYRKIPVSGGAGPGGFAANDVVAVGFSRAGDAGVTPSSFPAGTAAAPGWAVTGDSNTGVAQVGGADTVSLVAGGVEALRVSSTQTKIYGVLTAQGTINTSFGAVGALSGAELEHAALFNLVGNPGAYNGDSLRIRNRRLTDGSDWTAVCWDLYRKIDSTTHGFVRFGGTSTSRIALGFNATERLVVPQSGAVTIDGNAVYHSGNFTAGVTSFPTLAKSVAYTVNASDAGKLIVATGTWTLGLPAAASAGSGFTIAVKNTGTGLITVDPNGSELVDQALTGLLASRQSVILVCDGAGWNSIGGIGFATAQQWSTTAISGGVVLSEGNLRATLNQNTSAYQTVRGANALPDGSTYWEVSCLSFPSVGADSGLLGIVDASFSDFVSRPISIGAYRTDGSLQKTSGSTAFGASWGGGDTMMFGFKRPTGGTGSLWIGKNGVWQGGGDPVSGANPAITGITQQVFPVASANLAPVYRGRFSPLDFIYTMPSGFSPQA